MKKINALFLAFLLVLCFGLIAPEKSSAAGFALTYAENISAIPNQIGLAQWRGETTHVGAAACLDPVAMYSNGYIKFNLLEVCGEVGGSVSANDQGKLSMPVTFGASYNQGALNMHAGYGPDILGKPVVMWAVTYPF